MSLNTSDMPGPEFVEQATAAPGETRDVRRCKKCGCELVPSGKRGRPRQSCAECPSVESATAAPGESRSARQPELADIRVQFSAEIVESEGYEGTLRDLVDHGFSRLMAKCNGHLVGPIDIGEPHPVDNGLLEVVATVMAVRGE